MLVVLCVCIIVGTADQLSLAIQHENEVSAALLGSEEFAKFACASYQDGADVCAWARSRSTAIDRGYNATWISPIFVSDEDDLLCMIIRTTGREQELAPEILAKLSFIVTLPAQLKLESNILELIALLSSNTTQDLTAAMSSLFATTVDNEEDDDNYYNNAIDLTVSYYSNATTIYSISAEDSPVEKGDDNSLRANSSIYRLSSYSMSSLDSFYWKESAAAGQDFNNSVSNNIGLWEDFADILDIQSSFANGDEVEDPCHFDNLGVLDMSDDIVVPLATLITTWDPAHAGACFAFLISEFAADPLVAHIVLTSRPKLLNFRARSIQQVIK